MPELIAAESSGDAGLSVEFAGEWYVLCPDTPFTIGRDADLSVDDNPFLHRRLLQVHRVAGFWWLANVGGSLPATLTAVDAGVMATLSPGARLPIVFPLTFVRFSARSTSYEVGLHLNRAPFEPQFTGFFEAGGSTTLGYVTLNVEQRQLLSALAEPTFRRGGTGATDLPTNAAAARRLGWPVTKFNRKLDYLCEKLTKAGVTGLHGTGRRLASSRRARLVEYAMSSRLITKSDIDDLIPSPSIFAKAMSEKDASR